MKLAESGIIQLAKGPERNTLKIAIPIYSGYNENFANVTRQRSRNANMNPIHLYE